MGNSPITTLVGVLLVVFILLRFARHVYRDSHTGREIGCRNPPATRYTIFPFQMIYNGVKSLRNNQLVDNLCTLHDRNGKTFKNVSELRDMIATVEPQNIKALLATQFSDFGLGTRHRCFYPFLGDGIFTLDGAGWAHARTMLRPQFSRDQVGDLAMFYEHVDKMMCLFPKDRSSFDIQRLFFLLTIDSSTHFLFDESIGTLDAELNRSGVLQNTTVKNAHGFAEAFGKSQRYLILRAVLQSLYFLINNRDFHESNKLVHEVVDHYVHLALDFNKSDQPKADDRYVFLKALSQETRDPKVIRDNVLNILLAGRDTTASLLSSAFFYLSRHPDVWNCLRGEVVREFGDNPKINDNITHAKLKDIPYLRYVVNEVLRLLPPVPLNFRVANKDTTIPTGGGPDQKSPIFVGKGTSVSYSVYKMHRLPEYWGSDAEAFRPERWQEQGRHGWEYLPFNGGSRICLGQQYALTETSFTLVKILQAFDTLETADEDKTDNAHISADLTLAHLRGVHVRIYNKT